MSIPTLPPSRLYQNAVLDSTRWQAFTPRADDIVISTSYKAGTTWTMAIVRELIVHAMGQAGITDPTQLPAPDGGSSLWPDARWLCPVDELHTALEAQPHRRFLKSHLALDGLPIFAQVNYLVVARDPRDVFMSLWNHHRGITDEFLNLINHHPGRVGDPQPRCPDDIHDFWATWISRGWFEWEQEGYPFWGNMHHNQSWWNYRHLDNILLVHYADLKADPLGEIRRIADFVNIAISDEALANVVDRTSFAAMRERAIATDAASDGASPFREGAKTFFHQGTNGRWRDVLSAAELAMYEQTKANVLTPDCARWVELGCAGLA
jgi:aryl sulfotransferase